MTPSEKNTQRRAHRLLVSFAVACSVSACGSPKLWQGQDVLVEARHDALEQNVGHVSEDHRELRDRFNALERLYVELVQHVKDQESQITILTAKLGTVERDPQVEASVNRVRNDVSTIRDQLKKLENRVFSVEMADATTPAYQSGGVVPASTSAASVDEVSSPSVAAETAAPAANIEANDAPPVGVHLASYRSQEQVTSGWANIERSFSNDLEGLTPLVYLQSQEGIGTFMRLVAGPLINEQEAEALCARLKETNPDQYCRVAEYQGEPIG